MPTDEQETDSFGSDHKHITSTFDKDTDGRQEAAAVEYLKQHERKMGEIANKRREHGGISYSSLGLQVTRRPHAAGDKANTAKISLEWKKKTKQAVEHGTEASYRRA